MASTHRTGPLTLINDPNTFSALSYVPRSYDPTGPPLPLMIYLHGAGENGANKDAWSVAASKHKTEGTPPEVLSCDTAIPELANNFSVISPHAKRGWIREITEANAAGPLMAFMDFLVANQGKMDGIPKFDANRVYITGHSDGATAALKAAATRRFAACLSVACGGGDGHKLKGVPVWLVHGANDRILPVRCSDSVATTLKKVNGESGPAGMKYTRIEEAPPTEECMLKGHMTNWPTYKDPAVYDWLLSKTLPLAD
eukprot:TRINITY_DN27691_c0_g1_i1.p1 TRINITY_DN27691_c0_g1~~TRINITY_DN27691_c0_g1_i1.p1  ORF type:complete len:256 (+),score=26.17 TRINITY_DN27691_c0_g1_i1:113-880(+)